MPLKLTSDPVQITRDLSKIAKDARKAGGGTALKSLEDSWSQNLKHLSGLLLDPTRATLTAISGGYKEDGTPAPSCPPVALNLILPRATRFIARHLNLMGGVKARPGTDDPIDKRQADAAARHMEVIWDSKRMDVAAMRALVYMLGCEHGYVMVEGDPKAEYRHEQDEVGAWKAYEKGEIVYKTFSPLQVDVYPGIQELQDSPAVIVEDYVTDEYLKRRWGIVPPEEIETAKYNIANMDALVPQLHKVAYKIQRLFIKPSKTRPLGEHHIIMGDKLVHSSTVSHMVDGTKVTQKTIGTWDFKYPLVDFADAPISFGYHGYGRQTAARTVIKILCAVWSRMVQCAVGMPGVVVDGTEGDGIGDEDLGNKPYLFLRRNSNSPPLGFNAIPKMPHHEAMIELCIRWLDEIYAQSPPSRGISPGSRFAAKGLEFLAQQDVLADTPTGKMVLKALQDLLRRGLGEGLTVWGDKHIEYILGEGQELEKIALEKGELEQGWDIFIVPGSGSLMSPEAQRGEINESFKLKLLDGPDARRLANYSVKEEIFEPKRAQSRIIAMEDEAFGLGKMADTNAYDDHEFHITEHDKAAARRHGVAEELELWQRQRHKVKHVEALGLQNQALVADQQAAEMEEQLSQGAEGLAPEGGPPEAGMAEPEGPVEPVDPGMGEGYPPETM